MSDRVRLALGSAGALALVVSACLWLACRSEPGASSAAPAAPAARDPRWAAPLRAPGLPNFHKVSGDLYRGAQPTPEGFRELKRLGIRTVVNLRALRSDRDELEDAGAAAAGLALEHISFKAWHAEDEDVVRFLKIATDQAKTPVFVHCQHGADRTGTMCAIYRMAVQGWSREDAIREMTEGGFGYHSIWKNLISYLQALDVEKLRREAGLPPR